MNTQRSATSTGRMPDVVALPTFTFNGGNYPSAIATTERTAAPL